MSDYFERIETHLLDALERDAKSRGRMERPGGVFRPRRLSRRAALATSGIAAIAGAVVLTLALTAGKSQSAYAVLVRPDGTVALTLNKIIGEGPANARLAQLGVRARLVSSATHCGGKVRPVPWTVVHHRVAPGDVHEHATGILRSVKEKRRVAERLAASKEAFNTIQGMIEPQKSTRGVRMIIHPSAIPRGLTLVLAFKPIHLNKDLHDTHGKPPIGIGGSIALYRNPVPRCLFDK